MGTEIALPAVQVNLFPAHRIKEEGDAGELRQPGPPGCCAHLLAASLNNSNFAAAFRRRDFTAASKLYGEALEYDPDFIPALLNRSLSALHTGTLPVLRL